MGSSKTPWQRLLKKAVSPSLFTHIYYMTHRLERAHPERSLACLIDSDWLWLIDRNVCLWLCERVGPDPMNDHVFMRS